MINKLNEHLLDAPSIGGSTCAACGGVAMNNHHVIQKGMGGSKLARRIPTVPLCGMGNTSGCHGKAHSGRLFFDYKDGSWMCLETVEPTTLQNALNMEGWRPCDGEISEKRR